VQLTPEAEHLALQMVGQLGISSHRAEITCLEAARAYAAADGRIQSTMEDVEAVAPMALRQRRSDFIRSFFDTADTEQIEIESICRSTITMMTREQRSAELLPEGSNYRPADQGQTEDEAQ
jgi:magnesium chelatase subunit I